MEMIQIPAGQWHHTATLYTRSNKKTEKNIPLIEGKSVDTKGRFISIKGGCNRGFQMKIT
jgi:heat shock protein HslJ